MGDLRDLGNALVVALLAIGLTLVASLIVPPTRLARHVQAVGGDERAAARAGIDVPYSCKSGVCATCRAKLVEGEVRMDRNFALEADELAAGFILTCQAHPLTPEVRVSFDHR